MRVQISPLPVNLPDMNLRLVFVIIMICSGSERGEREYQFSSYPVYSPRHEIVYKKYQTNEQTVNEGRTTTHIIRPPL